MLVDIKQLTELQREEILLSLFTSRQIAKKATHDQYKISEIDIDLRAIPPHFLAEPQDEE